MTFANMGMRPDYLSQYRYSGSQSPSSVYQPIQSVSGLKAAPEQSDLQEVIGGLSMANVANSAVKGLTGFNPAGATVSQIKEYLAANPSVATEVGVPTYEAAYTAADTLDLPSNFAPTSAVDLNWLDTPGSIDWSSNAAQGIGDYDFSPLGDAGSYDFLSDGSSAFSDASNMWNTAGSSVPYLSIAANALDGEWGWNDTGAAVGSFFGGPVGGMIGSAIGEPVGDIVEGVGGAVSDAVEGVGDIISGDGTVICTELHRQGLMSEVVYKADTAYGRLQDCDLIAGYHLWAKPLVKLMQKSTVVTKLVRVLADPWSKEMAFRMGVLPVGNIAGKFIMVVGHPICRVLGKMIQPKQQLVGV